MASSAADALDAVDRHLAGAGEEQRAAAMPLSPVPVKYSALARKVTRR